jgi:arylsulfatase A-like enzyme
MRGRARKEAQGYYAHCTALDGCIGDLLETLELTGVAENTIFVFTADHGEMLGSQGQPPKQKQRPWDESIRVPFLLRYPGKLGQGGRTVAAPINTPDILPTLLALAGIEIPNSVEGEDLSRFVTGERSREDRAALVMNVAPFGQGDRVAFRGIRTSRYTYVRKSSGPWLLYDNQADPYQMKNLLGVAEHSELQSSLERSLQAELLKRGDAFHPPEHYRMEWGYQVDAGGNIPYFFLAAVDDPIPAGFMVQSPDSAR